MCLVRRCHQQGLANMRPIQLIILLVAFGAAGLAGLMATRMMASAPVEEQQVAQPAMATEEVLVVTKDIGVGNPLTADAMTWRVWPAEGLAEGFITKTARPDAVNELQGTLTRSPFLAGEPMKEAKLVRTDRGFLAAVLAKGMRAVAVRVNAASTAGGFILPEDKVDIILVRQSQNNKVISETILSNVRVLALDQNVGQNTGDVQSSFVAQNTATLELAPDQAELIAQAQQMGTISLSLRSIADNDTETTVKRKSTGVTWVRFGVPSR